MSLRRITVYTIALIGVAVLSSFSGCGRRDGSTLKRHDLFSIPLGTLPGELDWFYRDGFRMAGTADIQTRDGLIFVSGGDAGKVMVFNSYGDLITFVYDPARNTPPAAVNDGEKDRAVSAWVFRSPRTIAAYDGGFLVDDGVEAGRRVEDPETGTFNDRVILRFDRNGTYLGHLGREGVGGSPFPYISSVNVRDDGGIVVTCRTSGAWMSYWFDRSGYPVATVRLREDQLPGLQEGGRVAVYSVRPDPVDWSIHIRLDFYPEGSRGEHPEPRLYTLDLTTLEYDEPLVLSYAEGDPESGIPAVPPDYLGTTRHGSHLMLTPEGAGRYRMVLIDGNGRTVQNRRIAVDAGANIYRRFSMQNNGMLTGIFFDSRQASVAWWRVDTLDGDED